MIDILNDMLELIYVADIENYELLFINKAGKANFKIDSLEGLKCYKALQGLDAPCSFCNNAFLNYDKTMDWSITNSITGRHYLLKDKLIDWEGRVARIEIAMDDTESENERISLKNALDAEKMLMEWAKQLYHTSNLNETFNAVLKQVGISLQAERAYIFEIRDNRMFNTFEWCAPNIEPQISNLQNVDIAFIQDFMPYFNRQECFFCESIENIKIEFPKGYQILSKQGIQSLVASPLEKDGKIVGYVGVDNPSFEKVVNIASLFRTLGYFVMSAIRKAEDEKRLEKLSYYDMLTGFYNRNRFMQDIAQLSAYQGSIGIAYLDINGLKDVNDTYGHSCGDEMLKQCAQTIRKNFVDGNFYRIGGDEFLVLCQSISEEQFNIRIKNYKNEAATDSKCSLSLGCLWTATVNDIQNLISKADSLMYDEKERFYRNRTINTVDLPFQT